MKIFLPGFHPDTLRAAISAFNKKGFTLIELLVAVLIIGILAAVALPQYQAAVLRSRYPQMTLAADAVARAQQLYYMANGFYTNRFEDLDIQMPAGGSAAGRKTNGCIIPGDRVI